MLYDTCRLLNVADSTLVMEYMHTSVISSMLKHFVTN